MFSPFTLHSHTFTLLQLTFQESISAPYRMEAYAFTDTASVDLSGCLAQTLSLTLTTTDKQTSRTIHGRIFEMKYLGHHQNRHYYYLRAHPDIFFLQWPRFRLFQNPGQKKAFNEVIQEIKESAPSLWSTPLTLKDTENYKKKAQFTQYNESDLHFMERHLAEQGFVYYFLHDERQVSMEIAHTLPSPQPIDCALVSMTQDGFEKPGIAYLSQRHRYRPAKIAAHDVDYENIGLAITGQSNTFPEPEHEIFTAWAYTTQEAQNRAKQETEKNQPFWSGRSSLWTLYPTQRIRVPTVDGVLRVVSMHHKFRMHPEDNALGHLEMHPTLQYLNDFVCQQDAARYRPDSISPPALPGLLSAKVTTSSAEQEIDIDNMGRVLVEFPWEAGHNSCRLRVMQSWAGNGFGTLFHPRKGMEVMVAFEEGDIDRPLVIGCVYNNLNLLPQEETLDPTVSRVRTNTTPGGKGFNEIRLKDESENELFYTHAQKDRLDEVIHDFTQQVHTGNLTIEVDQKDMYTHIKGTEEETTHKLTIEHGNDITEITKGNQTRTLKEGDRTITLDQGDHATTLQDGDYTITLQDGDVTVTVAGSIEEKATKDILLEANTITLRARQKITLEAPSIEIKGAMSVEIEGTEKVSIQSEMHVSVESLMITEIKGTAETTIKGGLVLVNS